jgi:DHA2 family multidrug resistance protein-like MFS transporter
MTDISASVPDGLPPVRRRWAMSCVLLALALSSLDAAIANIALPTIERVLSTTSADAVWVVNAYQLAVTICLLPAAALSESLGLRRVYASGLAIFTVASLACALSPTITVLVCARLAQGVGGSCMSVSSMALVRTIYPKDKLRGAYALVALAVATSSALGPTLAALILAVASWPWLFLVNVPFGAIAVPLLLAVAPPDTRVARRFDWTGAALNALAFGLIIGGVHYLGGASVPAAAAAIAAGLVCLGVLARQQKRQPQPMLPLDLLRIPEFALSVAASICTYAAQVLAYVSIPFLFETSLHLTPVQTGLLVTPWPLLVGVTAPLAGRLMGRYPADIIASVGLLILAGGLVLMAALPAAPAHWNIVWRLALCGIGFGLFQTPNNTLMMTIGPVARSSAASGLNAAARFVGMALGSAVVAGILGVGGAHATVVCLEAGVGFALVGAAASIVRRRWHRRTAHK